MASMSINGTHLLALTHRSQANPRNTLTTFPNPVTLASHHHRRRPAMAAAAAEAVEATEEREEEEKRGKEAGVVVRGQERPRVVLKFLWMEKNIGLALDQVIPGHGTVPLSPYYFWPRKDAWEELKSKLEEKPWISQKRTIIILNQATDVINLWQQSGGTLSSSSSSSSSS